MAHHRAVVGEAVLQQQLDAVRAQVPGRRPVAARVLAGQRPDRRVAAHQLLLLAVAPQGRRDTVRPAVVAHLVPGLHDLPHAGRVAFDGVARDEPRGGDPVPREQGEDARNGDDAEVAARDHGGGGEPARDHRRRVVVVERQAHQQVGHAAFPNSPSTGRRATMERRCRTDGAQRTRRDHAAGPGRTGFEAPAVRFPAACGRSTRGSGGRGRSRCRPPRTPPARPARTPTCGS